MKEKLLIAVFALATLAGAFAAYESSVRFATFNSDELPRARAMSGVAAHTLRLEIARRDGDVESQSRYQALVDEGARRAGTTLPKDPEAALALLYKSQEGLAEAASRVENESRQHVTMLAAFCFLASAFAVILGVHALGIRAKDPSRRRSS